MKLDSPTMFKELYPLAPAYVQNILIHGISDLQYFEAGECVVCFQEKDWLKLQENPKWTELALVIVPEQAIIPEGVGTCVVLPLARPRLAFAKIMDFFVHAVEPSIHPTAIIHPSAVIGDGAMIGPYVVIHENCVIEQGAIIDAHCTLYPKTHMGANARLYAHVSIGSPGFGFERVGPSWKNLPHCSGVKIGQRSVIGSFTAVAAGILHPTTIGDDVIIDNHVQIAHHVSIGSGTAIAGCVGIAGSAKVGRNCMIGGSAMITGHITIADGVVITGMTMVTKSLKTPGMYSSGLPVDTHASWKKTVAAFHRMTQKYLAERMNHSETEL